MATGRSDMKKRDMAILQSCCCWNSVRKGSFACGIYTAIYYTLNAAHSSIVLHEEVKYFQNDSRRDHQTFLDHDTTSKTSITFTILNLSISSGGIITSFFLLYGLYRDNKLLLIPWIFTLTLFIIVDFTYIVYMFFTHALEFNPSVAILITMDLFITSLNTYSTLCVISQYQELKAGRGRALDDRNRIPNIQYSAQPTATSYLSTRRPTAVAEGRPSPTASPSGAGPPLPGDDCSPTSRPRKSVKFPSSKGAAESGRQYLEPWTTEPRAPLIGLQESPSSPRCSQV